MIPKTDIDDDVHFPHRFDEPLEQPPGPKSPAAEVAAFIEDVVVSCYCYDEGGWTMSEPKQRWFLRTLCETSDWSWPQVTRALRKNRIAGIAKRMGEEGTVEGTASGIPVFLDRFPEPQPFCPFKRTFFHIGSFTDSTIDQPCVSPSCKECAPHLIEELLGQVKERIEPLEAVYVAQVPWNVNLTGRLAQRRHDHGMNTFTYRDVNDIVTIIGDKPLEGKRAREAPTSSEKISPVEATTFLVERVLWIPGHVSDHFSEGWAFPTVRASGVHISLDGLDDDQIGEFKRRAAAIVMERYDIDPSAERIPVSHWKELKLILQGVKKEILDGD